MVDANLYVHLLWKLLIHVKWDAQQGLSKINFWETINYQRLQSINLILEKINPLVAINCN